MKSNKIFKILNKFANYESFCIFLLNEFAKICTCLILNKNKRREKRIKLTEKWKTRLFTYQILRTAKSVGEGLWCGGFCEVTPYTVIKDYANFNGMRIMGDGNVTIGSYFHSGVECLMITRNHNYDNGTKIPYDESYIRKDIVIEDFVWLGSRVMILPGTKIGEGAIIQGGSVVHGEIPPYAIAGGNPAKVFKFRNIEHFQKLKKKKAFF